MTHPFTLLGALVWAGLTIYAVIGIVRFITEPENGSKKDQK